MGNSPIAPSTCRSTPIMDWDAVLQIRLAAMAQKGPLIRAVVESHLRLLIALSKKNSLLLQLPPELTLGEMRSRLHMLLLGEDHFSAKIEQALARAANGEETALVELTTLQHTKQKRYGFHRALWYSVVLHTRDALKHIQSPRHIRHHIEKKIDAYRVDLERNTRPDAHADARRQVLALEVALGELRGKQDDCMRLLTNERMTNAEIAAALNTSEEAVKMHLRRARAKLAKAVRRTGPGEE